MRFRLPVGISLLALASAAAAADWVEATKGHDGRIVYLDIDSIRRSGDDVRVWVMHDLSKVKSERARRVKYQLAYKCADETLFTASVVSYAPNGDVLRSEQPIETRYDYKPVVPDTIGESLMKLVCPQS